MRTVSSFLRYGAFLSLPHSFGIRHYFIRYAAVCCGCLSWLHQWRIPHRTCRFYLLLAGADKETAFCLGCLYCFLQYRIPHRICRFYLLLAGAVGKRQGISIPYPSPTPLLTPLGDPLRRGILAAAVDRDIGSLYPVQVAHRHFDVSIGCFVFGLGLFAFQ